MTQEGIKTNVTLVFTEAQGLMAAKAGATYISPFIGRLDDIGADGVGLVQNLKTILDTYGYETEIIAASIRNLDHLVQSSVAGAHIATIPGSILPSLWNHPLTTSGIETFVKDWGKLQGTLQGTPS